MSLVLYWATGWDQGLAVSHGQRRATQLALCVLCPHGLYPLDTWWLFPAG